MNKINFVIIACILASLFYWFSGQSDLITQDFAFSAMNLANGKVWTLVTGLFLHADILHLLGNMVFLYAFGNALEKEVGAGKTCLAFFVGGIFSFLLGTLFYDSSTFMIGASAAIFTLTAVVMLFKPLKFSFIFFMPLGLVAIIYIIYNVLAVQSGVESSVAYIAHVIGFAIGVPFGIAWTKNLVRNLLITMGLLVLYIFIIVVLVPYFTQTLGI